MRIVVCTDTLHYHIYEIGVNLGVKISPTVRSPSTNTWSCSTPIKGMKVKKTASMSKMQKNVDAIMTAIKKPSYGTNQKRLAKDLSKGVDAAERFALKNPYKLEMPQMAPSTS